jgi:hypothetical protein
LTFGHIFVCCTVDHIPCNPVHVESFLIPHPLMARAPKSEKATIGTTKLQGFIRGHYVTDFGLDHNLLFYLTENQGHRLARLPVLFEKIPEVSLLMVRPKRRQKPPQDVLSTTLVGTMGA